MAKPIPNEHLYRLLEGHAPAPAEREPSAFADFLLLVVFPLVIGCAAMGGGF